MSNFGVGLGVTPHRKLSIMSETNDSVGAVIILLLNAFEQSTILTVSYVIRKACYALFVV